MSCDTEVGRTQPKLKTTSGTFPDRGEGSLGAKKKLQEKRSLVSSRGNVCFRTFVLYSLEVEIHNRRCKYIRQICVMDIFLGVFIGARPGYSDNSK